MLEHLEELLDARDIPFDAQDRNIMCFPHVTAICVTHVTEAFTDIALASDDAEYSVANAALPPADPERQTYEEAVARDPIALCRGAVCAIRASGKRRDHFCEIIRDGNDKEWFKNEKGETIQIPNLELLRDVRTRWDSLYKMISRFRDLRQVSEKFHYHSLVLTMQQVSDHFLSSPLNKDLARFRMTDAEWGVLKDFQMILSVCPHVMNRSNANSTTRFLIKSKKPYAASELLSWQT